uniref:Uncharacterized protein n=1 Tax=Knipowitschia caucasica TaxID=637954 RepID=A0AAV2KI58_KNICA
MSGTERPREVQGWDWETTGGPGLGLGDHGRSGAGTGRPREVQGWDWETTGGPGLEELLTFRPHSLSSARSTTLAPPLTPPPVPRSLPLLPPPSLALLHHTHIDQSEAANNPSLSEP